MDRFKTGQVFASVPNDSNNVKSACNSRKIREYSETISGYAM
jgi:hypothetical protein